ncbi:UNVERIFIED_CONTAM: hypothetical protein FKN15_060229 [Acipenser sinensis]
MEQLLSNMFDGNRSDSVIVNGIQVLLTLLEPRRPRKEGGRRRGYMGHLTRIANHIAQSCEKGPNQSVTSEIIKGMLFFALAHVCYSLSFSSRSPSSSSRSCLSPSLLLLLSLSLWVFAILSFLYFLPHLSVRKDSSVITPAVGVYTFLIAMMANLALVTSRPLTMAGALFFMTSDLTLALHTFVAPLPCGRAAVMTTYYLAQVLIAVGGVREGSDVVADGMGNRKRK